MENLIKARLNQSQGNSTIASNNTTSNVQTSRPAAAPSPHQGGLDVHPEPGNLLKGIDNKTIKGHLISEQICEDIDFPKSIVNFIFLATMNVRTYLLKLCNGNFDAPLISVFMRSYAEY